MEQITSHSCQYDDEYDASDDSQNYDDSDIDENDTYIENIDILPNSSSVGRKTCYDASNDAFNCSNVRNVKNFSDECGELTKNSFTSKRQVKAENDRGLDSEGSQDENRQSDSNDSYCNEDELRISRTNNLISFEDTKCMQG